MSICVPLNVPGCVYAFVGNVESERVHANLNWSYLDACLSVCCVLERGRENVCNCEQEFNTWCLLKTTFTLIGNRPVRYLGRPF